ncbi:hypothetical protein ACVPLS_005435, partial [Escherichia coli]
PFTEIYLTYVPVFLEKPVPALRAKRSTPPPFPHKHLGGGKYIQTYRRLNIFTIFNQPPDTFKPGTNQERDCVPARGG